MSMHNTTHMALQAAIAIAIAEWVSWYFSLHHGYWVTLTTMALIMQTFGESVKRSLERVSMTVLGGIFGTALHFILPENHHLFFGVLLISVFFTVYLLQIYYLIAVFFLTCFVVFLFSLLNEWTVIILRDRILETGLGAMIALFVGFCFHSVQQDRTSLFINFLYQLRQALIDMFQHTDHDHLVHHISHELHQLRKKTIAIRYEFLFHQLSNRDFYVLLNQMSQCTQYVIHLVDAISLVLPHINPTERQGIDEAIYTSVSNIDALIKHIKHKQAVSLLPVSRLTQMLTQEISQDPTHFVQLEDDALGYYSLMYFFTRLNRCLHDMNAILLP